MADPLVLALATHTQCVRFEKGNFCRTFFDNLLDHLVPLAGITARLTQRRVFPGFVFQRYYPIDFPNFPAILAISTKDKPRLFIWES